MISKLPRWVWLGAGLLAFIAGMINVVSLMSFDGRAVSHLTGNTSTLAIALAQRDTTLLEHVGLTLLCFVLGTILSGILIENRTLRLGRPYGVSLLVESILLFAAVPLLTHDSLLGTYLSAAACGLQNGMVSLYSGAVIRTTHLTGIYTDLGTSIGHLLRGGRIDRLRFALHSVLLLTFAAGGVVAALGVARFAASTLLLPATLTGLTGLGYTVYRRRYLADSPSSQSV